MLGGGSLGKNQTLEYSKYNEINQLDQVIERADLEDNKDGHFEREISGAQ